MPSPSPPSLESSAEASGPFLGPVAPQPPGPHPAAMPPRPTPDLMPSEIACSSAPHPLDADRCSAEPPSCCWICLEDGEDTPLRSMCQCPSRPAHELCLARWCLHQAGKMEEKRCRFCFALLPDYRNLLEISLLPPSLRSPKCKAAAAAAAAGNPFSRTPISSSTPALGAEASASLPDHTDHDPSSSSAAGSEEARSRFDTDCLGVMVTVQCGLKAFQLRMLPGDDGRRIFEQDVKRCLGYQSSAPLMIEAEFELPDPCGPPESGAHICLNGMDAWDAAVFCAEISKQKSMGLFTPPGSPQKGAAGHQVDSSLMPRPPGTGTGIGTDTGNGRHQGASRMSLSSHYSSGLEVRGSGPMILDPGPAGLREESLRQGGPGSRSAAGHQEQVQGRSSVDLVGPTQTSWSSPSQLELRGLNQIPVALQPGLSSSLSNRCNRQPPKRSWSLMHLLCLGGMCRRVQPSQY